MRRARDLLFYCADSRKLEKILPLRRRFARRCLHARLEPMSSLSPNSTNQFRALNEKRQQIWLLLRLHLDHVKLVRLPSQIDVVE